MKPGPYCGRARVTIRPPVCARETSIISAIPLGGGILRAYPGARGARGNAIFQLDPEKCRRQVDSLGSRAVTICKTGPMNDDDRVPKDSSAPEGEKPSHPPAPKTSAAPGAADPRAASAPPASGASANKRTLIGIPAPSITPPPAASAPPAASTSAPPFTSSVPPAAEARLRSERPTSRPPSSSNKQTLIGIPAPSVPSPGSFGPAPVVPSISPPAGVAKPASSPPPTLAGEEEEWEAAFEAGHSQAPVPKSGAPKPAETTAADVTPAAADPEAQPAEAQAEEAKPVFESVPPPPQVMSPSATDHDAETRIDTPAARAGAKGKSSPSQRPIESKTSRAASAAAASAAAGRARDSVPSDAPTANSRPSGGKARAESIRPQSAAPQAASGGPRLALLLVAAAIVGGAWFFLKTKARPTEPVNQPVAVPAPPALTIAEEPKVEAPSAPEPTPAPAASVAPADEAASALASASAAPSAGALAVASAAPAGSAVKEETAAPAASGDLIVVTVTAVPPDARFFYKGRAVSSSPMRVELKPGEKRVFEIGRPGYRTRRVVVDGSQLEMSVGMRPEAAPAP